MNKNFHKLTKNKQIIAIICNQWGDTGKGKFSDYFAKNWADVIARGTGGDNAGHTVIVNDKKRIFHILPAGIIYDNLGKINILGNGMVINIKKLVEELEELKKEKYTYKNLQISTKAQVIMPYHIIRDQAKETLQKKGNVGSTGRGIGPCYTDKIARRGITIEDLLNKKILSKKIKKASFYYPEQKINSAKIIKELNPYIKKIKPFIKDTISEIHKFKKQGKKILLEGAQGLLLSIEFGTYPFVTSSDCSLTGTSAGVGLSAKDIDLSLGIVKFPFMTRVGAGPFPTEFGGKKSEIYCANDKVHNLEFELKKYKIKYQKNNNDLIYNHQDPKIIKLINSKRSFLQGIGIRLAGEEYGATTKRPRRTGWTDLEALKYAVKINGENLILTKADVLALAKSFSLAYGYDFTTNSNYLYKAKPQYKKFAGFSQNLSKIKKYDNLPISLKKAITFLEKYTNARVRIISTGPKPEETIIV